MKNITALLFISLFSITAFAQSNDASSSSRTIVKFSPLYMFVGDVVFSLEQQLKERSSLEVELGATITELDYGSGPFSNHTDAGSYYAKSEHSQVGMVASLGFRYYLMESSHRLNGIYLSPIFKFKQYNTRLTDPSGVLTEDAKASKAVSKFLFNFGVQLVGNGSFSVDFHAGVGLGFQSQYTHRVVSYYEDGAWSNSWEKKSASYVVPAINVGIKLGLAVKK